MNTSYYVVTIVQDSTTIYVRDYTTRNVFLINDQDLALRFDTYEQADQVRKQLAEHRAIIMRIVE
jgi:hypothetical protein